MKNVIIASLLVGFFAVTSVRADETAMTKETKTTETTKTEGKMDHKMDGKKHKKMKKETKTTEETTTEKK